MVEPTASVARRPILRPIAPPGVEPLRRGDEVAAQIDPAMAVLKGVSGVNLNCRVAHHIQQLLVAPHIAFKRGNVEIPHQNCRIIERR